MAVRCVKCNADSKAKQLDATGWRCPACGHRFTARPRIDGISDTALKRSLDKVTAGGTEKYLPEQFAYEIQRRRGRNQAMAFVRTRPWLTWGGTLLAAVLLSVLGVPTTIVLGITLALAAVWGLRLLTWRKPVDAQRLARQFEQNNPSGCLVTPTEASPPGSGEDGAGPMPALTDRVLVVQHKRMVDFFHANSFDLHHACAVIGPGGYGAGRYPGLAEHLASTPGLSVMVLHEMSPQGSAFVRHVEGNPGWLAFAEGTQVSDLGLNEEHRALLGSEVRDLSDFQGRSASALGTEARGSGVELAALAPVLFLGLVGTAVADGMPLVLPPPAPANSGGGGGGGDSGG